MKKEIVKKTNKIELPREFRKKWLEMLTSGKYKQTTEKLACGAGYCCLGVAGRALGIRKKDLQGGLPSELNDKFALKYPDALVEKEHDRDYYGNDETNFEETSFANQLIELNDTEKNSFKEIAAYIRSNTVGV
jgi:antitoxin component YwqK of YwqJK toxin-antitoxin module